MHGQGYATAAVTEDLSAAYPRALSGMVIRWAALTPAPTAALITRPVTRRAASTGWPPTATTSGLGTWYLSACCCMPIRRFPSPAACRVTCARLGPKGATVVTFGADGRPELELAAPWTPAALVRGACSGRYLRAGRCRRGRRGRRRCVGRGRRGGRRAPAGCARAGRRAPRGQPTARWCVTRAGSSGTCAAPPARSRASGRGSRRSSWPHGIRERAGTSELESDDVFAELSRAVRDAAGDDDAVTTLAQELTPLAAKLPVDLGWDRLAPETVRGAAGRRRARAARAVAGRRWQLVIRIARLDLERWGHFDGRRLTFGSAGRLHVVFGANEAGKSTTRRAVSALLFGVPGADGRHLRAPGRRSARRRAAGGLDGTAVEVVRRKGRKNTLLDADGEVLDPAPLDRALGGLSGEVHAGLFEITHDSLVAGRPRAAGGPRRGRRVALRRRRGHQPAARAAAAPGGRRGRGLHSLGPQGGPQQALALHAEAVRTLRDAALRPPQHEALARALEGLETAYARAGDRAGRGRARARAAGAAARRAAAGGAAGDAGARAGGAGRGWRRWPRCPGAAERRAGAARQRADTRARQLSETWSGAACASPRWRSTRGSCRS